MLLFPKYIIPRGASLLLRAEKYQVLVISSSYPFSDRSDSVIQGWHPEGLFTVHSMCMLKIPALKLLPS
jgi:hypothetical protein